MKVGTSGSTLRLKTFSLRGFLSENGVRLLNEPPLLLPLVSALRSHKWPESRWQVTRAVLGVLFQQDCCSLQTPPFCSRAPCVRPSDWPCGTGGEGGRWEGAQGPALRRSARAPRLPKTSMGLNPSTIYCSVC